MRELRGQVGEARKSQTWGCSCAPPPCGAPWPAGRQLLSHAC